MSANPSNTLLLADPGKHQQPWLPELKPAIEADAVYSRAEAAKLLGISLNTLDRIRAAGNFPAGFCLSPNARSVRWTGAVLLAWIEGRQQQAIDRRRGF